jgi:hypothetical protein
VKGLEESIICIGLSHPTPKTAVSTADVKKRQLDGIRHRYSKTRLLVCYLSRINEENEEETVNVDSNPTANGTWHFLDTSF